MEEFIRGEIQTFDGLVDREGRGSLHELLCPSGLRDHGMVSYEMDTMHYTLRKLPDDLVDFGLKTVKAGSRERFSYQFFRTGKGLSPMKSMPVRREDGALTCLISPAEADLDRYAGLVLEGRVSAALDRPYHVLLHRPEGTGAHPPCHGRDEILNPLKTWL